MSVDEFLFVVADALEVEVSKISLKTDMADLEQWDSLGHLTLLSAIDKATDGAASKINSITELTNIGDLYSAITK